MIGIKFETDHLSRVHSQKVAVFVKNELDLIGPPFTRTVIAGLRLNTNDLAVLLPGVGKKAGYFDCRDGDGKLSKEQFEMIGVGHEIYPTPVNFPWASKRN